MKNNINNLTQYILNDRSGRPFVQVDTDVVNGKICNLTSDAKTMLTTLLSLPSEWDLYIEWLNKTTGLTKERSKKARKELIEKGFLEQIEITRNGKKAYIYVVYEIPKDVAEGENLTLEIKGRNSNAKDAETEKCSYINKDNKEKIINKNNKYNKKFYSKNSSKGNKVTKEVKDTLEDLNNSELYDGDELVIDEKGNPITY